jgi:2-dehydropantoate 2-reductase
MRILVVGAGATGGYFGGRLAQAGRDVTFLVRPQRAGQLRANGLQIISPHGDVTLAPRLVLADDLAPEFDAVLMTVKAYALEAAIRDVAPAVGPATMIMPVLNGMRHVDAITGRFGASAFVGGVCKVATMVDDKGRIVQLNTLQELAYGEMDGSDTPRLRALDEALGGAGFPARRSITIAREMWEKWVMLATLGGVTCLMRGSIGAIEAAPGGADFVLSFLDEVVAIANRVGEAPSAPFLDGVRKTLTQKGSAFTASMYRDLEKGAPIEGDQIIGDLLRRGQEAGLATPLLAAAYAHLSVYQNKVAGR